MTFVPATRYGVPSSTVRCQYRWYAYLLEESTSCVSFTAARSDSGTSWSEKPFRAPELAYSALPSEPLVTSSTLKRWLLLAISCAVRWSSYCSGSSGSRPAWFCISCWKSRSTASWVRVSTASRLSQ